MKDTEKEIENLNWEKGFDFEGEKILPTVVVDRASGKVLMLAFSSKKSLEKTLETGKAHFFSRSKGRIWMKGETSGNELLVKSILYDCDLDSLIFIAKKTGPVCHTGEENCFFNLLEGKIRTTGGILFELENVIEQRKKEKNTKKSWTAKLLSDPKKLVSKIREEAEEFCQAVESEGDSEVVWEFADLLYHCLVALSLRKVPLEKVMEELARRREEKDK